MFILYNSRDPAHKRPIGTLRVGEAAWFCVKIPAECGAYELALEAEGLHIPFAKTGTEGLYDVFCAAWTPDAPALHFYRFSIRDKNGSYHLYKNGDGTNMEAGEDWQMSVLPADYAPPEDFRGAVYYQIFPDRFYKSGDCDLRDKLTPFELCDFDGFTPHTADASDFAGGNLRGIAEKLDYLHGLGVRALYLNPVFMARSNHRYDTADYKRIDPLLGTESDFADLCDRAHARGMRVILDGVFSHTGAISRYFDVDGRFSGGNRTGNTANLHREWYSFSENSGKYDCWWGNPELPNVRELTPSYLDFILRDEDSVVAHWLRAGADGFRLDVADELPDEFIALLRARVKELKPEAVVLGEVWEDASNKLAYGVRRRYFTGAELDGVINYPFRKAILDYASGADDGTALAETVRTLAEHYPAAALDCTMSVLGTHDTERLATALPDLPRRKLAAFLQFCLPGSPVIYYGDEAGLAGGRDPMNRLCFPWGREDRMLTEFYRQLAALKNGSLPLRKGTVEILEAGDGVFRFARRCGAERVACLCDNRKMSFGFVR